MLAHDGEEAVAIWSRSRAHGKPTVVVAAHYRKRLHHRFGPVGTTSMPQMGTTTFLAMSPRDQLARLGGGVR